ncbi:MAG TPA: contractile injection system tape measure protein, partial [Azospirillaceae bacterium]|nr:contractile injection system tape measure protein [Azospirillaceae bacterium]
IAAVLAHWTIIRNTSPTGLRETFLQREGRLERDEGRWNLTVQRKTLDVLVDQVPWGFSVVYHRWMRDPIHVSW